MPAWSGFWGDGVASSGSYSLLVNKNPLRNRFMKQMINREGHRKFTALFNGLIGAASGSNVTATSKKISQPASSADLGGARTIDTVTSINRNTTAADVTALKEMTYLNKHRPTYVKDLSGNGGPAFSG